MYDPSLDKTETRISPPIAVVNAQPVGFHSGTYASPAPQGQFVSAAPSVRAELAHGINTSNTATVPRPAPGRWKDGICDWPQNLSPSCYCVCCFSHGMWLLAQISQRTGFATFNAVIYMTIIVWVVAFILNFFYAYAFYWFPIICFYVFALLLRMHFVRHQNINDNPMGLFGEFCCGFWCWYCSVSQMARHLYGYSKVLDGDGDPYRTDGYGPIGEV